MMDLIKTIKDDYGLITKELNTGGGYGIVYTDEKKQKYQTSPILLWKL